MAERLEIASLPWGYWVNGTGVPRVGVGPTGGLKTRADAAVTIYAAETGATPYGGAFVTGPDGLLPGWVDEGRYKYVEPLDGTTRYVEATSGGTDARLDSVESGGRTAVNSEAPRNLDWPEYEDLAVGDNWKPALDAAAVAIPASGGAIYVPARSSARRAHNVLLKSKTRIFGDGPGSVLKLTDSAPALSGSHTAILASAGAPTTTTDDLTIEDLELDGNVANNKSSEFIYCVMHWGGKRTTIRNIYGHDVRSEVICLNADTVAGIHHEDFLIENIKILNAGFINGGAGNERQGIAVIRGSRGHIKNIQAKQVAQAIVDLEANVAADVLEQIVVDGVTGEDCRHGVAILGHASATNYGNIVRDVTLKDGANTVLTNIVILGNTSGTLLDGGRATPALAVPVDDTGNNTGLRVRNYPGEICRLTRSADQTGLVTATSTAVAWNSEREDIDGQHESVTNPSRVNILIPGWYKVDCALRWGSALGTHRTAWLRKNGAGNPLGYDRRQGASGAAPQFSSHSFPAVQLTDGDYIEVMAEHDKGSDETLVWDVDQFPELSVVKVG